MSNSGTKDLTTGNAWHQIIFFALPLVTGQLFQQLNGVMEGIILGRFVGANTLAAVGIGGTVYTIATQAIVGMTSGFAIIVTRQFGMKDERNLKKSIAGMYKLSILFAVILTAIMLGVNRISLNFVNTPPEIFEETWRYCRVQYSGIITCVFYYMMIYLFGALGNGVAPLCMMGFCTLATGSIDLLLIGGFGVGIEGAAWGNVIGQGMIGTAGFLYAWKKYKLVQLKKEDFQENGFLMRQECKLGVNMAFQMMFVAVGNFFVQGSLNLLGTAKVSAYTAFSRVTGLFQQPAIALGVVAANFTGQNLGANRMDRIKEGNKIGVKLALLSCVLSVLIMVVFGRPISAVFLSNAEEAIIRDSMLGLNISSVFFIFVCLMHVYRGTMNGLGHSTIPFVSGAAETIMRVVTAMVLPTYMGYTGICLAFSLPWAVSCVPIVVMYYRYLKKNRG